MVEFDSEAFIEVYSRYTYSADPEREYMYVTSRSGSGSYTGFLCDNTKEWHANISMPVEGQFVPSYAELKTERRNLKCIPLPNGNELYTSGWKHDDIASACRSYLVIDNTVFSFHIMVCGKPEELQEKPFDYVCSTLSTALEQAKYITGPQFLDKNKD